MLPGSQITTILNETKHFLDDSTVPRIYNITIVYNDSDRNEYKENYKIDLSHFIYKNKTADFSQLYYLNLLHNDINNTNKQITKLNDSLKDLKSKKKYNGKI